MSWLQSSENSRPPLLDEAREALPLLPAEPDQLVAGHEEERERQQLRRVGGDDNLLGIDRDLVYWTSELSTFAATFGL